MQRKRFQKITKLTVATMLISSIATAQTKNEFSVRETVDYGLKNAIDVKNALLDIQLQEQTNREFTANALPQAKGTISATYYFDIPVQSIPDFISPATYGVLAHEEVKNGSGQPIQASDAGTPQTFHVPFGSPWNGSAGLEVRQLLFDGEVFAGLKARSAAMDFYRKKAEVTQEQIKASIVKVYYQLVVGKQQLATLDANIDRFDKLLFDTKEIYKNGLAEKLDVDKVQVQLNNLQTEKEKVSAQLQNGYAGLKFLINMPQKDELILTDTLGEEQLKADILATEYNYNDRKEIQLLTISTKLNEYNIKRYKQSGLPTLSAFGSYGKISQRSEFDFFHKDAGDWFTSSLVGLNVNIPIFDGNARRARLQKARYDLQKTQNTLEQTKQNVDYEITQARISMKSAILTVDNQKQNMVLAEKVYDNTKKKYEQGLGNNQEIYNAQTELKTAQSNYYNALYYAIIAKVDYLKAAGKL